MLLADFAAQDSMIASLVPHLNWFAIYFYLQIYYALKKSGKTSLYYKQNKKEGQCRHCPSSGLAF